MKIPAKFNAFAASLFVAYAANAALFTDKAIDDYADKRLKPVIKQCEQNTKSLEGQNKRLEELSQTVQHQSATINEMLSQLKEVQAKLDINAKRIDNIPVEPSAPLWIKVVLGGIAAIIFAVLGLFFWPRKSISTASGNASGRPKCPRCGWEHDPGDTICKNPACKTQF